MYIQVTTYQIIEIILKIFDTNLTNPEGNYDSGKLKSEVDGYRLFLERVTVARNTCIALLAAETVFNV